MRSGPTVFEVPAPVTGATTLTYTHDDRRPGAHPPEHPHDRARWRLTPDAGPGGTRDRAGRQALVYADERFTLEDRPRARSSGCTGMRAAKRSASERSQIGEDAIEQSAALLGVTETEPVDFFIYADQASFYDALGPGTRENVGGQADAEIRTLFALIPPSQIDDAWVEDRDPARAHAPRVRHGGPTTRTTSRRAGSTRASRSTRARATGRSDRDRRRGRRERRLAHPAPRADRAVPHERRPLPPRLRGERVGRGLPDPHRTARTRWSA